MKNTGFSTCYILINHHQSTMNQIKQNQETGTLWTRKHYD